MNCPRCSAPLEPGARFCRNCGLPLTSASPAGQVPSATPSPDAYAYNQPQPQPPPQQQWGASPYAPTQNVAMPASQAGQASFGLAQGNQPGQMVNPQGVSTKQGKPPRKRRWPMWVLIILGILVVLIVGGWFLVARPILHNYAQDQLNQQLTNSLDLILPAPPVLGSLRATQTMVNNLLVLNHAPSDPVQNAVSHISPPVIAVDGSYTGGVQLSFTLYGFSCSIAGIPVASNGNLVVTHVQVSGVLSWIMSSDELTTLLNSRLQEVSTRLHRSITAVTIKNQEIDITLG